MAQPAPGAMPHPRGPRGFELLTQAIAWVALALILVAPLFLIHHYHVEALGPHGVGGAELTVGIAVILRATARRLLRSGSGNLMRTTLGVFTRASGRTATRRFVKFAGRVLLGNVVRDAAQAGDARAPQPDPAATDGSGRLAQAVSLGLGFVVLCLSFLGVLAVVGPQTQALVTLDGRVGRFEAALLAGLPLLIYAALHRLGGRLAGVRVLYRTEIDGILLQAYFTGAGSFLPLSTDVDYQGSERAAQSVAIFAVAGLFVVFLGLAALAKWGGSPGVAFVAALCLIYCFIYCFPIKPLDGRLVWQRSRLVWLLVALPILLAFLYWLPAEFGALL